MKNTKSIKGEMSRNDFDTLMGNIDEIMSKTDIFQVEESEMLEEGFGYNGDEPRCFAFHFCTVSSMSDLTSVLINLKNYPKIKQALDDVVKICAKLKTLGFSFNKDSEMADLTSYESENSVYFIEAFIRNSEA